MARAIFFKPLQYCKYCACAKKPILKTNIHHIIFKMINLTLLTTTMRSKSIKGNSPGEIQQALQQSSADGFTPTLAIVFMSIKQDRKIIGEILHNANIDFVGATSCGEFIDGYQSVGSTVILLMDLRQDAYSILLEEVGERNLEDAATDLAEKALQKFKRPAFILCSTGVSAKGEFFSGPTLLHTIEKVVGSQVNIFGGMAGDDATLTGTFVFTYGEETDKGMVALVLNEEKVSLQGMAISGWKALGTAKTVTKSDDDWLYEIEGQPALELYLRYLGKQSISKKITNIMEEIGFYYPFLTIDAGDPIIRTPLMIDEETKAIKLDFPIQAGKQVQFSLPPDFDIIENVLEKANEIKSTNQSDAEALLIFSCAGRHTALGPLISSENDGLHQIWKVPTAGFFTYGEYGRGANGKPQFHSTTCSWVALKEK